MIVFIFNSGRLFSSFIFRQVRKLFPVKIRFSNNFMSLFDFEEKNFFYLHERKVILCTKSGRKVSECRSEEKRAQS